MAYSDSFRINIAIADTHCLTSRILDVSNSFHDINVPNNKRVCVNTTPCYLDWMERSYPNVPLNLYECPIFLQGMNEIQVTKQSRQQCNRFLDAVVMIIKKKAHLIIPYTKRSYLVEQCP